MANQEEQDSTGEHDGRGRKAPPVGFSPIPMPKSVTDQLAKINVRLELSDQAKANLDRAWWSAQNTPAYKSSIERINISLQRSQAAQKAHARLLDALSPVLTLEKLRDEAETEPDAKDVLESAITKVSPEQTDAIREAAVEQVEALENELGEEELDTEADEFIAQNTEVMAHVERLGILDHLTNNPKLRKRVAFLLGVYITILCTFGILSVTENASPDTQKLISASGFGGMTVGGATTLGVNNYFDKRAKRSGDQGSDEDENKPL